MNRGYVYIISNDSIPNLLKVGYTLKNPELRAKELYTTGVPTEYIVEYWILVDNPYSIEQRTHLLLKEFNYGKEWFKCNFEYCYYAIQRACEIKFYDEYFRRDENKKLSTYILMKEQEQVRIRKEQDEQRKKQLEEQKKLEERKRLEQSAEERKRSERVAERRRLERLSDERYRQYVKKEIEQEKEKKHYKIKKDIQVFKISALIGISIAIYYFKSFEFFAFGFFALLLMLGAYTFISAGAMIFLKDYTPFWVDDNLRRLMRR